MTNNSEQWWYCLKHNRVEDSSTSCPGKDLLGPYATREEAEADKPAGIGQAYVVMRWSSSWSKPLT